MSRNVGWALMAGVFGTLVGAMAVGCTTGDVVAEVDADLSAHFGGYTPGTIDEVVSVQARGGAVHVALVDGVPVFVGAEWWSPTADFAEASGGYCVFE